MSYKIQVADEADIRAGGPPWDATRWVDPEGDEPNMFETREEAETMARFGIDDQEWPWRVVEIVEPAVVVCLASEPLRGQPCLDCGGTVEMPEKLRVCVRCWMRAMDMEGGA